MLLNFTTSTGNQTEKVATPNQTVRGFGFIDGLKSLLEAECPGIVSCADIIALAARDSIVLTVRIQILFEKRNPQNKNTKIMFFLFCFVFVSLKGGPSWKVPTGRRDGVLSNASEALAQIPAPFDNITTLIQKFANKSLDIKDLVLLSGTLFFTLVMMKFDAFCLGLVNIFVVK